jgi:hypothetical protein
LSTTVTGSEAINEYFKIDKVFGNNFDYFVHTRKYRPPISEDSSTHRD